MAEIISNQFTTTINKSPGEPSNLEDNLSTVVNIYIKGITLTVTDGIIR